MKKVLISRFGAYGDHLHASHLPRLLKEREGFDYVAFEYNTKGAEIYENNPFIDEHIFFEPASEPVRRMPFHMLEKRWAVLSQGYDRFINLRNSIEYAYIAMEDQADYYMSDEHRRAKFGGHNYYDQTTIWAGYPQHVGVVGELYFSEEEEAIVQKLYRREYSGKFVVIANLSGTSKHKLFYNAEAIVKQFLAWHSDAVCITVGDEDCRNVVEFKGERIINRCGNFNEKGEYEGGTRYPFRQAMLMTKYAGAVVGCESGLMVAATLLGAPTVQLMTAASIKNHGGDFPNDLSIQSPAACSPCHKGPYEYIGCPTFEHLGLKYPICIKFDPNQVLSRLEMAYQRWSDRRDRVLTALNEAAFAS